MAEQALVINEKMRRVTWRVALTSPGQHLVTPWGELWRGEEQGAGQVVWVRANERFDLTMMYGPTSYFETITPGRQRFILTLLDSTDVA